MPTMVRKKNFLIVSTIYLLFYQERFTSTNLLNSKKRVTRSQMKNIRRIFPFLDLPPELRCVVYEHCVTDLSDLDAFFDGYYNRLITARATRNYFDRPNGKHLPPVEKKAPNVFFINRQIFNEAVYLFYQNIRRIRFDHGMLDIVAIKDFISPHILQNVRSIHITDAGHNEVIRVHHSKPLSLPQSWNGYMHLLTQLGTMLSETSHKLQDLTINFSRDQKLGEHMNLCWEADHICGFKDQMRDALDTFRGVRGVGKVTLIGLNPGHSRRLKTRMESKVVEFKDLPRNVRNIIYGKALGWKDISGTFTRAVANWPEVKKNFTYPQLSTPTVLLLNKEYSAEAHQVLAENQKELSIVLRAGHNLLSHDKMPFLGGFIGTKALKKVQSIDIKIESREWLTSIDRYLISGLSAFDSQLKSFSLFFSDEFTKRYFSAEACPDLELHKELKRLQLLHGLDRVAFSGHLPSCYTGPLAAYMMAKKSSRSQSPMLMASYNGYEIDFYSKHALIK